VLETIVAPATVDDVPEVAIDNPAPLLVLEAELGPATLELLGVDSAIIIDEEVVLVIDEEVVVTKCPG
jgi:hypothetical protein